MKKMHYLLPMLAMFFCCWASPSFAQENNRVIIIKKSVDENGVETIEKIIKEGEDADVVALENLNGENIWINMESDNDENVIHIEMKGDDGTKTFSWNGDGSDMEDLKKAMKEMKHEMHFGGNENVFLDFSKDNSFSSCNDNGKPFLGVVMKETVENHDGEETIEGSTSQGVIIQEVVEGSAAEAAGLKEGDIMTSIDGEATLRVGKVSKMIQSKKVGDAINITYLRDGNSMQTSATLKARDNSADRFNKKHFEFKDSDFNFDFDFDFDRSYHRDPCKVFIGVYTSTSRSTEGVRVNGVIDDTPAFEAGLLKGDVIKKLDGVSVNSHQALLSERNKHEQGEEFTITYVRDGETYTVDATFKSCDEEEIKEEPKEDIKINRSPPGEQPSNLLDIKMEAFPNPTDGVVNVRFDGEKTATTVTITDINGKEIYREEIANFDGVYNKKVNLKGAALGPVVISVQQGSKVTSDKVMYVPSRA